MDVIKIKSDSFEYVVIGKDVFIRDSSCIKDKQKQEKKFPINGMRYLAACMSFIKK